jgi:arylamine N-acetyltransferase
LNTFYYDLLKNLGYQVEKRSSCVLLNWDGSPRLDTHITLIVTIDQAEYLCDIGASEYTPLEPILIPRTGNRLVVESCFDAKTENEVQTLEPLADITELLMKEFDLKL